MITVKMFLMQHTTYRNHYKKKKTILVNEIERTWVSEEKNCHHLIFTHWLPSRNDLTFWKIFTFFHRDG